MSYQSLARKYRPARFADLVGQDSVARALANGIAIGREPHGLLFTGVRGVGKTTIARIYAKALNCPDRTPDSEPCDRCDSCKAVTLGNHEDVMEIDGASNTSVNDVRMLQETIHYVPQRSQFKVYIIDEVHMLSPAAFNALLKTLEEPPSHVVFVFATTEVHKVPETILSRCQTFYLKKLSRPLIQERLATILRWEGIEAEDHALSLIAREGHGSMRDALTILDQGIALGGSPAKITELTLEGLVSHRSSTLYLELLQSLIKRDAKAAFQVICQLDQGGAEFTQVAEEVAGFARHGFILKALAPSRPDPTPGRQGVTPRGAPLTSDKYLFETEALGLDDQELATIRDLVQSAQPFDLNRIFRTMTKARQDLDGSNLDRFIFENYVFEWCLDPGFIDISQLLETSVRPGPAPQGISREAPKNPPVVAPPTPTTRVDHHPSAVPSLRAKAPDGTQFKALLSHIPQASTQAASSHGAPSAPVSQISPTQPRQWPKTWRELLDFWRLSKPLFARKLEEVLVLEYQPDRLILGVHSDSYSSKALLQPDEQRRIADQLKELFGFQGVFQVRQATTLDQETAGETILLTRQKEAEQMRLKHLEAVRVSPLTQALTSALGATIEDVRIQGDGQP
jgi:DNA polymerase-3 subunit gamma/tau